MKYYCDYCKETYDFSDYHQIGAHRVNCSCNPNRDKMNKKRSKTVKETLDVRKYEFTCEKCGKMFTVEYTEKAYNKAKERGNLRKYCSVSCSSGWRNHTPLNELLECPWCGKFCKAIGIMAHVWRKHMNEGKNFNPFKNVVPWNKGLTKETDERLKNTSNNLIHKYRNGILINNRKGKKMSDDAIKRIKKTIQKRIEKGEWNSGNCGYTKKIKYNSLIAGEITVDGSWELKVAKYFDEIEVNWKRNKNKFRYYSKIKGRYAYYFPDFYVEDWNKYIEVKGYKTGLDDEKWSQFPEELEVWDEKKLVELGIIDKWKK